MKDRWDDMTAWYQALLLAYDQTASHDENEKEETLYKALGAKVQRG